MNDPLPSELEDLMQAERVAPAPSARRDLVLRRLESSVAALAVGAVATGAGAAAGAAIGSGAAESLARGARVALRGKIATALVAATIGAAGGGAIGYGVGTRAEQARHARIASVASSAPNVSASAPVTIVEATPVEPTPLPSPSASASPVYGAPKTAVTASAASAQPSERDTGLAEELALVHTARTALTRGDAAGALETAERHRRQFPRGRLAEERESVAIQALARLGRQEDARRRAADFEQHFPTSVFLPIIRRTVRSIP